MADHSRVVLMPPAERDFAMAWHAVDCEEQPEGHSLAEHEPLEDGGCEWPRFEGVLASFGWHYSPAERGTIHESVIAALEGVTADEWRILLTTRPDLRARLDKAIEDGKDYGH